MPGQSATVTKSVALGGAGSREAKIVCVVPDTSTAVGSEIVSIDAGATDAAFPNTFGYLSLTKAQFDALTPLIAGVVADARQGAAPG